MEHKKLYRSGSKSTSEDADDEGIAPPTRTRNASRNWNEPKRHEPADRRAAVKPVPTSDFIIGHADAARLYSPTSEMAFGHDAASASPR